MVNYSCKRCGYHTYHKSVFQKHLYRKNICKSKINDIDIEDLRDEFYTKKGKPKVNPSKPCGKPKVNPISIKSCLICEYCNKIFKKKQGKYKHVKKYCKVKKQKDKEKKEDEKLLKMIHELIEENKEIKEENKNIIKKLDNIKNNSNKNIDNSKNKNIDNSNNITINNYGNEDISFLTPEFLAKLILQKGVYTLISNLIKEIHFNKEFPENKNLKITNKKQPYINVYENGNWKLKDKKETIKDIVDDKSNLFDCINSKNNVIDLLPRHYHKTRFEKYKNKYDQKDPETIKKILKNSELEILNSSIEN